jgi:glycosyltransferase involved in cell wall biosynthesis
VNCETFNPKNTELPRSNIPIFLYVGRVSKEKGIEDFLNLKFPFLVYKYIVGGGPYLEYFKKKYQHAACIKFLGPKQGKELATIYASSDVFVFPSKSDTFGIVLLEALASGLPIAAYHNQPGPTEVIEYGINGYDTDNLEYNAIQSLLLAHDKEKIADTAKKFSWLAATNTFLDNLTHV